MQLLSKGQGLLLVMGFGLLGIGGVGVGMDNAKLMQRERFVGTLFVLPGQVECLVRVLPTSSPRPAERRTSLSCA